MERRYAQESTARFDDDGKITWCSNETDSEGRFKWRKDGSPSGECLGIDFAKASLLRQQGACNILSGACPAAEVSTFVPFAYDAGIAMAHTLHHLLEDESVNMMDISGRHLIQALSANTTFVGTTGTVSFHQGETMGERDASDVRFFVFVHHGTSSGFDQVVGTVDGGKFNLCDPQGSALAYPCTGYTFPDGSSEIPPDTNPCAPENPCKHGGNCTVNTGYNAKRSFNCSCTIEWLGDTCEETRYCSLEAELNQIQSPGMRIKHFPEAKTSVPLKFDQLREIPTQSECHPGFRFQGNEDFELACCSVPGPNGTRGRALVQLKHPTACETYERLLESDGLLGYGANFFNCTARPKRFIAYNFVALVLIGLIAILSVAAIVIVIIYRQCIGALDTSLEWVKSEMEDEETCVPGSEQDTRVKAKPKPKAKAKANQIADEESLMKQVSTPMKNNSNLESQITYLSQSFCKNINLSQSFCKNINLSQSFCKNINLS